MKKQEFNEWVAGLAGERKYLQVFPAWRRHRVKAEPDRADWWQSIQSVEWYIGRRGWSPAQALEFLGPASDDEDQDIAEMREQLELLEKHTNDKFDPNY